MTGRWYCPEPCLSCDGTGEGDWLSGARCYECGGTGMIDDDDDYPADDEDERAALSAEPDHAG